MKYASDFRTIARKALMGKWAVAVIAGIIASLLGASTFDGPKVEMKISGNGANLNFKYADYQVYSSAEGWAPELQGFLIGSAVYFIAAAIVMAVLFFILGSVVSLGYSRFNLDLIDGMKVPEIPTLFVYFSHWKHAAIARLLQFVYVVLWSLLLIFPGIIASYSYAMTSYILAEHPEMAPREAIERSREMMSGNRWRLFCLQFSFIGWGILSFLTLGIGNLWLNPYKQAATAAFYRDLLVSREW